MKSNLMTGYFICLFSVSGASHSANRDITHEDYINSVYSASRLAWPVLENIWGTHVYRQLRLIVADDHNAWSVDSKSLIKIPYNEIQKRQLPIKYLHYQEIQWPDGRPTIYVSLGSVLPTEEKARFQSEKNPVPLLFNVATHEAFHFFVQANQWKRLSPGINLRATPYPVQVTPRFYRHCIIRALYSALQGDKNGLGHARYWYDLWKKSYPDEASHIRQADIDEGSARYIEIAAKTIAEGYPVNTAEYRNELVNNMKEEADFIYTRADSKGFTLGALSCFILEIKKIKWQESLVQGVPPIDILLEGITPVIQTADNRLEADVNKEVSKINTVVSAAIDNFTKDYNSPGIIKIFVSSALSGSHTLSGGFFRTRIIPHDLMVGLSSSANWPGGSYSVKEVVAAAIEKPHDSEGERGFLMLFNGRLPPSDKGRLVLKTRKLTLNIPYPEHVEKTHIINVPRLS